MVVTREQMELMEEGKSIYKKCDNIEGEIDDMLGSWGDKGHYYSGLPEGEEFDKLINLMHDLQGCRKELQGFYEKHPKWWIL